jgi:uncharacterized membrane protein YkvA (DUF1232 family)
MIIQKLKSWARELKQQAKILQVGYVDHRTPTKAKILIWITLGYLFSPIDLIPDFIPILGLLDDIIIVPLLIAVVIKLIPKEVWTDATELVKNQQQAKWGLNWPVIIFICVAWLLSLYLIFKLMMRVFF